MKVAIDSWVMASRFRHQGIYVYARQLAAEFQKLAAASSDMSFCLFTSPTNSNDAGMVKPSTGFELRRTSLLERDRLWRLGGVSVASAAAGADLLFAPTSNVLPTGVIPVVTTIHDLSPIKQPSHPRSVTLMMRSFLWCAARFSRAIITDSESSKKDLMEVYGVPESKVFVVYLGYDKTIFNDDTADPGLQSELLHRLSISRPYILHHGTIQPRKNLKRLIGAFRLLQARKQGFDFDLVLVGKRGWGCEEILATAGNGSHRHGKILFAGAIADRDLALLVKGASLVVVPSLYEGFCLPMIESMACGTPTITANSSCLPEVSGGVLNYFDPLSVEDMAAGIENALQSVELRKSLSLRGKERAAQFDWERCARETIEILKASNPRVR